MMKNFLKRFVVSLARKAEALGAILVAVTAIILLAVGVYVAAQLQQSLPTSGLSSSAQSAINNVFSTGYNTFTLLTIVLIVLAAMSIVGVVVGGLAGRAAGPAV